MRLPSTVPLLAFASLMSVCAVAAAEIDASTAESSIDAGVNVAINIGGDSGGEAAFDPSLEAALNAMYTAVDVVDRDALRAEELAAEAKRIAHVAERQQGQPRTDMLKDLRAVQERAAEAARACEANAITAFNAIERASELLDRATLNTRVAFRPEVERASARRSTSLERAQAADDAAKTALAGASATVNRNWKAAWENALRARCVTAICWGGEDGRAQGVEPMIELPVGLSWGFGHGALADYVNSSEFRVEFTAGLRFWFRHDFASFSLYFAKPIFTGDSMLRPLGSEIAYPTSAVRRVYPSLGIGLLGDILFLGIGLDELRNPTSGREADPRYTPGAVVSRSLTFTLGLAPFTAIRNGIGAAASREGK